MYLLPTQESYDTVLYDSHAAAEWFRKVQTGQIVSVLEHNSAMVAVAMMMDAIANPERVTRTLGGSDAYAAIDYSGPYKQFSGSRIPACGFLKPPSGAAAAEQLGWFKALEEFARRTADNYVRTPGNQPDGAGGTPALWAVFGPVREALILRENASAGDVVTEDPSVAPAGTVIYQGATAFTARLLAFKTTGMMPAESQAEIAAQDAVNQLDDEMDRETSISRKRAAIIGGTVAALMVGATLLME